MLMHERMVAKICFVAVQIGCCTIGLAWLSVHVWLRAGF